jgi:cardiolipin synthase
VLGRDVLILITAAVILVAAGYRRFPPSIFGKLTTTFQIFLVFTVLAALVFPHHALDVVRQTLVYVVAAFTVFSGFHYSVVVARRLSQD